jgi:NitT/TauT family transport system substrate-binding protein
MHNHKASRHLSAIVPLAAAIGVTAMAMLTPAAQGDETKEVKITRQYGLGYLPLMVVEEQGLIEKRARAAGLGEIKMTWITVTSGPASTDAILSSSVDYIASGVAPLITLWSKTNGEVRGVAALDSTPIVLNSVNPAVKSLKDFTENDRIALPGSKVSIQAVFLQMAAAKEFGDANYAKLDPLTVTVKHPDAAAALLSGHSEINAHLSSPPFTYQELKDTRVHTVLNSFDVLGPHTFNVLSTTKKFYDQNPKTYAVVLVALEEAEAFIANDKRAAAEIYLKSSKSKETVEEIVAEISDPHITYTTTPLGVTKFSDFMNRVGTIKTKPTWKDLFFPNIHDKPGS